MQITSAAVRRRLVSVLAATALGGGAVVALMVPSATASPDPCAAGSVAKTVGKVSSETGDYLDKHPETNQAVTGVMQDQSGPESVRALKTYFEANPKAQSDIQKLTEPLASLSTKCKLSVSLPQLLGLMQAAQNGGGLPGGAPGGPGTQAVVGPPGSGAVPVPRPGPAPATVPPSTAR